MKSKIYLILFALFAFSCSSDSSSDDGNNNNGGNNNSGNSLLVSEIITTTQGYTTTDTFFYNDGDGLDENKLTSATSEYNYDNGQSYINNTSDFIYTNNRIARVDTYEGSSNNLARQVEFDYDSQGRLTTIERCYYYDSGTCYDQTIYSFSYSNNNNTITETYSSSYESQLEFTGTRVWQLDNNGNFSSAVDIESYDDDGDGVLETEDETNISFEHDNFNNPFSGIAGASARVIFQLYNSEYSHVLSWGAFNNLTGANISFPQYPEDDYTISVAYDYNEDGYPRQAIISDSDYDFDSVVTINYY